MDPVSVTITATDEGFTVEYNGESETYDSVDRALQEARGYLVGAEADEEMEDTMEEDFAMGFQKARGTPL